MPPSLPGPARRSPCRLDGGQAQRRVMNFMFASAGLQEDAKLRVSAARTEGARPLPAHPTKGDEARYATTRIGSYPKGLPHNALGEVDPAAYAALLGALASGRPADFEAIPMGGAGKFADPQSS